MEPAIKDGFESIKRSLKYFEIVLSQTPLRPDGDASTVVALMHCHGEIKMILEAYEDIIQ